MSEEKEVRPSETPEPSAPEVRGHQASGSSPAAVATVRTLQRLECDIQEVLKKHARALERYERALSAYEDAQAALQMDPTNKVLSDALANAKESRDSYKHFMDVSQQGLTFLETTRARLQAASEQKSKFFFRLGSVPLLYSSTVSFVDCTVDGFVLGCSSS